MLWHLEMIWNLQHQEGEKGNLEIIGSFFDSAAQAFEEYPIVMNDALAFFLQQREDVCWGEMSTAEKLIAYPDLIGIERVQLPKNPKKEKALHPYIGKAIEADELPQTTDIIEVSDMLDVILIGGMMTSQKQKYVNIQSIYRRMLKMLWQGLHSSALSD
jgi:hypothetical protein